MRVKQTLDSFLEVFEVFTVLCICVAIAVN